MNELAIWASGGFVIVAALIYLAIRENRLKKNMKAEADFWAEKLHKSDLQIINTHYTTTEVKKPIPEVEAIRNIAEALSPEYELERRLKENSLSSDTSWLKEHRSVNIMNNLIESKGMNKRCRRCGGRKVCHVEGCSLAGDIKNKYLKR